MSPSDPFPPPADAFSPPANLIINGLGPTIFTGLSQCILQGALLSELCHFFADSKDDPQWLKWAVGFVNLMSFVQTTFTGYSWWRLFVIEFGEVQAIVRRDWPEELSPVITVLMSAPVHAYFIYRSWKATNHSVLAMGALAALGLATLVTSIMVSVEVFQASPPPLPGPPPPGTTFTAPPPPPPDELFSINPTYLSWLLSTADMSITGILISYLLRSRVQSTSRYLNRLIDRLMRLVWESAIPPCCCALATTFLYIWSMTGHHVDFWPFFAQDILGKLYCVSLMVTLNSRNSISRQNAQMTGVSSLDIDIDISSDPDGPNVLRIDIDRDSLGERSFHSSVKTTPTTPTMSVHGKAKRLDPGGDPT